MKAFLVVSPLWKVYCLAWGMLLCSFLVLPAHTPVDGSQILSTLGFTSTSEATSPNGPFPLSQ